MACVAMSLVSRRAVFPNSRALQRSVMAPTSAALEADSDTDGYVLEVVAFRIPFCRCPIATLRGVLFVPDERFGRCFECLNRIDAGRLRAEQRFVYIVWVWTHLDRAAQ